MKINFKRDFLYLIKTQKLKEKGIEV